ncbi:MAG: hypothetical protein EOP38_01000 [Rubrivivax sp.]|nr:MAG: hypothetical protein EOP38_01000 [Rubrivivax sp.]
MVSMLNFFQIGLAALVLCLMPVLGHAVECTDLTELALQRLFDARAIEPPYFTACGAWPGDTSKRIVLLARYAIKASDKSFPYDDTEGTYDLDIAVQDQDADGKTIMRLTERGFVISDAISLQGLAVDSATYNLAPGIKAFAIRASRANRRAEVQTLSMYAVHHGQLMKVMGPMNAFTSFCESANDASCFRTEAKRSTLTVVKKKPSSAPNWADLMVTQRWTLQEATIPGEAHKMSIKQARQRYRLRFNGQTYPIPAPLRVAY